MAVAAKEAVVGVGLVGQAVGLFAVTNVDGLLVLSLFFAQGAGLRGATARTVVGQYLGFVAILADRPVFARLLGRWGNVLLPLVLITLGLSILARAGVLSSRPGRAVTLRPGRTHAAETDVAGGGVGSV